MNVRLLVTFVRRFMSCDLDLHIRTYLDILKMYLDNKNELSRSRLSKVNLFTADPVLSFFLSLFTQQHKSVQTAYKSGQDRKAARAALITALNTSKTHVV